MHEIQEPGMVWIHPSSIAKLASDAFYAQKEAGILDSTKQFLRTARGYPANVAMHREHAANYEERATNAINDAMVEHNVHAKWNDKAKSRFEQMMVENSNKNADIAMSTYRKVNEKAGLSAGVADKIESDTRKARLSTGVAGVGALGTGAYLATRDNDEKTAGIVSGVRSIGKNLYGRQDQIKRLHAKGDDNILRSMLQDNVDLGINPGMFLNRASKYRRLATKAEDAVKDTRRGAIGAGVLGGAYLATRDNNEKTASILNKAVNGAKNIARNLGGRQDQINRLRSKADANTLKSMLPENETDFSNIGSNLNRSMKYRETADRIADKVRTTRTVATGIGGVGLASIVASREKSASEKVAFLPTIPGLTEIPYGFTTYLTHAYGENQLKHGLSEGIRGIRNMVGKLNLGSGASNSTSPVAKALTGPRAMKIRGFLDRHKEKIEHATDTDKWEAGARITSSVMKHLPM